MEQGAARAVRRPRAVGRRAPRVRARGRDQGVQARGVLVGRRHVPRRRSRRRSRRGSGGGRARRPSPRPPTRPTRSRPSSRAGDAVVATVEKKERRKKPQAPFITSRLQQDAARKLRFSAKRTMALAQRLYEGVELGDEGPTGLITYMRTDSTRVSDDAMTAVREHITETYGAEYLPERAEHVRQQGARAGRPRGDPPDADGVDARARRRPRSPSTPRATSS